MGNGESTPSQTSDAAGRRVPVKPQYNMRVLVKGEKNVGKTSLIRMLREEPFEASYVPSTEISALPIEWFFKNTNENIRCDLWDVVDSSAKKEGRKAASQELMLAFQMEGDRRGSVKIAELDASTYDVFRGAHAVLLLYDPHKRWTFEYVQQQLQVIPSGMDVLVIAGHRDNESDAIAVTLAEARSLCEQRPSTRLLECSALNGFGKTQILAFFNLPFLRMQREYLEARLARNAEDMQIAREEFDVMSFEIDYGSHLKWANAQRSPAKPSSPTPPAEKTAAAVPATPVGKPVAAATAVARAASPAPAPEPKRASLPPPVAAPPPRGAVKVAPVADSETLDDFLHGAKTDGWGDTIESDDESDENVLVGKPMSVEEQGRQRERAKELARQEEQRLEDDRRQRELAKREEERLRELAVAAALEEAKKMAEQHAPGAPAAAADAPKKKKGAAKKKKKGADAAAAGAAAAPSKRSEYAAL